MCEGLCCLFVSEPAVWVRSNGCLGHGGAGGEVDQRADTTCVPRTVRKRLQGQTQTVSPSIYTETSYDS